MAVKKKYKMTAATKKKKAAYDKKMNAKPAQVKKRVEANAARRKAKKTGKNIKGKQFDHAVGKFVKAKTNQGRKGEGGRKKGVKQKKTMR